MFGPSPDGNGIMLPVVAKDASGGRWFKSDQYVTNISEAGEFYVKHRWLGFGSFSLIAVYPRTRKDDWGKLIPYSEYKEIGRFHTALEASFGLEEAMRLKGIVPVSS